MNIILVGVGGAGMSALARLFLGCGLTNIIGIDSTHSEITQTLKTQGCHIIIGHGKHEIQPTDFVIFSAAAHNSPEVQAAINHIGTNPKRVTPPMTYFQFLGEISKYFTTIAIAGAHGKSTTTALTGHALHTHHPDFGLCIVGAGVADRGGDNVIRNKTHQQDISDILHHIVSAKGPKIEHLMKKHLFVVEACEYKRHFLHLDVDIAAITNIELDHADIYDTFENYLATFQDFAKKTKKTIITFGDTTGLEALESTGTPIEYAKKQTFTFAHLLGNHNHLNASLARHIAQYVINHSDILPKTEETVDYEKKITNTLQSFSSLRRRGELLGHNVHGVPIITDYAHHPTELASTIHAIREKYVPNMNKQFHSPPLPDRETKGSDRLGEGLGVRVIFQPHQARRVVEFRDDFVSILKGTKSPIVYNIYTARETVADLETYNIQSQYLQSEMGSLKSFDDLGQFFVDQFDGTYTSNFLDIQDILDNTTTGVILICTAGDLDREVRKYLVKQR